MLLFSEACLGMSMDLKRSKRKDPFICAENLFFFITVPLYKRHCLLLILQSLPASPHIYLLPPLSHYTKHTRLAPSPTSLSPRILHRGKHGLPSRILHGHAHRHRRTRAPQATNLPSAAGAAQRAASPRSSDQGAHGGEGQREGAERIGGSRKNDVGAEKTLNDGGG